MAKPLDKGEGNAKFWRDETKALHKYRPDEKRALSQARRRAVKRDTRKQLQEATWTA